VLGRSTQARALILCLKLNRAEFLDLRVGDLNGDGRSDLVWRADAGQLGYWLPTQTPPIMNYGQSEVIGQEWRFIGDGDFSGDGKSDLLWRHNNGTMAVWIMNGSARTNASVFAGVAGTNWGIESIDDFNGDGRADILWREDTGRLAIWGMNGTSTIATSVLDTVPDSWEIVGSGLLKGGDQKADILWFNAQTREVALWDSASTTNFAFGKQIVQQLEFGWQPLAIADFNGDGFDDVLYRKDSDIVTDPNTTRADNLRIYISGTNGISANLGLSIYWNPELVLTAVGDFNRDRRADLMFSQMQAGAHKSGVTPDGNHTIVYSTPNGSAPDFATPTGFSTATTWMVM
jgi:FG-GAP-like repeat/FG-GAP repeat